MKKKQVKLEIPVEQASYYAISCSSSLHQLSWELNAKVRIDLRENFSISLGGVEFPTAKDEHSSIDKTILIVKNRVGSSILIKELPNIDYVVKIQGSHQKDFIKGFIAEIKRFASVVAAIPVDAAKVKGISILQNI